MLTQQPNDAVEGAEEASRASRVVLCDASVAEQSEPAKLRSTLNAMKHTESYETH